MDTQAAKDIVEKWMIPTSAGAYMAGLENRPIMARAEGIEVIDTTGKRYLDFGSGQMAAALGHNHPRFVASVKKSLETISHSTKTFLNVDRLELHKRLGRDSHPAATEVPVPRVRQRCHRSRDRPRAQGDRRRRCAGTRHGAARLDLFRHPLANLRLGYAPNINWPRKALRRS